MKARLKTGPDAPGSRPPSTVTPLTTSTRPGCGAGPEAG
jgi:hypothetical protein